MCDAGDVEKIVTAYIWQLESNMVAERYPGRADLCCFHRGGISLAMLSLKSYTLLRTTDDVVYIVLSCSRFQACQRQLLADKVCYCTTIDI